MIPVAKPLLPPAHAIEPYLREIDCNGRYANFGPLHERLQARLAEHWGVASGNVALLSSATSGLTLALLAQDVTPGKHCLLPSWTFAASAGAVVAAGMVPHFVDVLPGTWCPDPAEVRERARSQDVGAILIVAPFGAPIDLAEWHSVSRETGCPLVIDAAAAFDTLRAEGPMPLGHSPVVVSLHATKVFGLGEGGALISRDLSLIRRVRALTQFGFLGTRESLVPGVNAKLSEYAAAVGLASFDLWPQSRARWQLVTQAYRTRLPALLTPTPSFGSGWVASTLTALCPDDASTVVQRLADRGIATLSWWGPGCHAHQAYRACPAADLTVTKLLARRAIGIPFYQDLTNEQVAEICAAVAELLEPVCTAPALEAAF